MTGAGVGAVEPAAPDLAALLGSRGQCIDLFIGQCTELILDVESQLAAVVDQLFAVDIEHFGKLVDSHPLVGGQAAPPGSVCPQTYT